MLDLDILLEYYRRISHIPIYKCPYRSDLDLPNLAEYYTQRILVEPGGAGFYITDEFLFCGKLVQKDSGITIFLGPVVEHGLTADIRLRIQKELGVSGNQAKKLNELLNGIPQIRLTDFLEHLRLLNYIVNQSQSPQFEYLLINTETTPVNLHAVEPVFHNTADFEVYFTQCIEHGRMDLLEPMLNENALHGMTMGDVSHDAIGALKNAFVVSGTLAVRAAIRGGLNYNLAMTLSDSYSQRLDEITSYESFRYLWAQMLRDFTSRTSELRYCGSTSPLVRDIIRHISGVLNTKITVEELAAARGVSSSYLSHHFKRETGETLTDYIAKQKVAEARRLIQTTDLSLAQISYQLAFSSQSYFHSIFKKYTGMTPRQYKNMHRNRND